MICRRLIISRRELGTSMPTRGLAGDALDQDRLGLQSQAQVLAQRRDAAYFTPARA